MTFSAAQQTYQDQIAAVRVAMWRKIDRQRGDLLKVLAGLGDEIAKDMTDRNAAQVIQRAILDLHQEIQAGLTTTTDEISRRLYRAQFDATSQLVETVGPAGFSLGVQFGKFNPAAMVAMVNRSLGATLSARIWGTSRMIESQLTGFLRRGLAKGLSSKLVARQIRGMLANEDLRVEDLRSDPKLKEALSKVTKARGFGKIPGIADIDLRKVNDPEERAALALLREARQKAVTVKYFTERLAITEMNTAHHEAAIYSSRMSPVTSGMRRVLSATHAILMRKGDRCDPLAKHEWYPGYGPGGFPKGREVGIAHPYDRCPLLDLLRKPREWGTPLPPFGAPVFVFEFRAPGGGLIKAREIQAANDLVQFAGGIGSGEGYMNTQYQKPSGKKTIGTALLQPGFKEDSPVFKPAQSLRAAEEWAIKNGVAESVDYDEIDLSVANTVNDRVSRVNRATGSKTIKSIKPYYKWEEDKYLKYHPEITSRKDIPFEVYDNIRNTTAAYSAMDETLLWGDLLDDFNIEDTRGVLIRDVASGWHPIGTGTVKAAVDHELGHMLYNKIPYEKRIEIQRVMEPAKYRGMLGDTPINIGKDLSQYAEKSFDEVVAEAWAEYCNNPNPRPLAKAIGDIIEDVYPGAR